MSFVVHRVSKSAARYTDAGGREKCGYCRFFVAPRACGKVIGPVSPAGWCKYFSRQAVSLSGGGISGGGPSLPPGVTLDLNFMLPGGLPPGVTFSRASPASYQDASGVIQTAAVDRPRWDYAGGSLRGLLIEEARTNLEFPSTNWLPNTTPAAGVSGVVRSAGLGLSGASDAMAFIPGTTNGLYQYFSGFAGAPSTTYTGTIYAKAAGQNFVWLSLENTGFNGVDQNATFNLSTGVVDNQAGNGSATITRCANGWYRCSVTATSVAAAGTYILNVRPSPVGGYVGFTTGDNVNGIWVWGQQVEAGSFPTSYIPTTSAAVTRAQDNCAIPAANMSPWFAPPGGSWFAEFIDLPPSPLGTNPRIVAQYAAGGVTSLWETSGGRSLATYDGVVLATVNAIVPGVVSKAASNWTPGTGKTCLNGAAVASATMNTGFAAMATSGIGILQGSPGVSSEIMTGYIRRVSYWPRVLSDAEMQQVTT